MRTLIFTVEHGVLKPDPECSFTGLFPAKNQEILAEFNFSSDWTYTPSVAAFYSILGKEYTPQVIDDGHCMIPPEALTLPVFKVQVLGNNRGKIVATNTLTVYQRGGKT